MERRSLGQQRQESCCSLYQYGAVSGVDGTVGVVCCCCSSLPSVVPAVVVTSVSEVAVLVLVVVVLVDNGIPLSHSHNVTWLSSLGDISSIPAAITPFNGASIPVELVWNTAVTMPLPPPSGAAAGLLNCTISNNVAVA